MKAKIFLIFWITVILGGGLASCSTQSFGPGPKGPIGPQGNLGPNEPLGSSSSDTIVIESNGNLVFDEYDFVGFDEIEIGSLMEVEISQGETYRITTSVVEDAVPYLQVSLEGKRLRIGLDSSQTYNISKVTLRAEITLPELTVLIIDGISDVKLEDFDCTHPLDLEVTGISSLEGHITGCDLSIETSDLSKVKLNGLAGNVFIKGSAISEVDISSLDFQELDYEMDETSELILEDN